MINNKTVVNTQMCSFLYKKEFNLRKRKNEWSGIWKKMLGYYNQVSQQIEKLLKIIQYVLFA